MGTAKVCEELDQLILHFFDTLEMLQAKREALNNLVEQGWFSKSHYAMGNKSVSTLQYGVECQVEFCIIPEDAAEQGAEGTAIVEEIGPNEQALRWQKGPGKTEDLAQTQNAATQPAEGLGHRDPLNWFGILVPQKEIPLAAEIASLQILPWGYGQEVLLNLGPSCGFPLGS
uniref:Vacuolar ATPase assembly protein VMA22 n=1 Tax=Varanus komodoensis TaxID=61221 RepID=A0A8D2IZN4_VARKO